MAKTSPLAIFLAASTLIAASTVTSGVVHSKEKDMGGLKEWTTDQSVDEESKLDEAAEKLMKEAEEEDYCIPIGEGENCW